MLDLKKFLLSTALVFSLLIGVCEPMMVQAADTGSEVLVESYSSSDRIIKTQAESGSSESESGSSESESGSSESESGSSQTETGTETEKKPEYDDVTAKKVLMIGNSMTKRKDSYSGYEYSVGEILTEIAALNRRKLEVTTITNGSAHLYYYAFPSVKYKNYYKAASTAIMDEQWDYIILQDQTRVGVKAYETDMMPAVDALCTMIACYQKNAKVLLYQTPGFEDGEDTTVDGVDQELTTKELQQRVALAYQRLSLRHKIDVVEVGMNLYQADAMYSNNVGITSSDGKHPLYAGYFTAACAFYYKIYEKLPDVDNSKSTNEKKINVIYDVFSKVLSVEWLTKLASVVDNKATISETSKRVTEGTSFTLTASVESNDLVESFQWNSTDSSVATVDKFGNVTAVGEGVCGIFAQTPSGLQALCVVEVDALENAGVDPNMSFASANYQVSMGDIIKIYPRSTVGFSWDKFTWESTNSAVATVEKDGTVRAILPGRTKIKVTYKDNSAIKAYYWLYVKCVTPRNAYVVSSIPDGKTTFAATIGWTDTKGATGYEVYYSTEQEGVYTLGGTSTSSTCTIPGLTAGTTYYFKVIATAGYVKTQSGESNVVSAVTPARAKKPTATRKGKKVTLKWKKLTGIDGYEIYRSRKMKSGFELISTVSASKTKYTDKTTTKKYKYYYKMRAYKVINGVTVYGPMSAILKVAKATVKK